MVFVLFPFPRPSLPQGRGEEREPQAASFLSSTHAIRKGMVRILSHALPLVMRVFKASLLWSKTFYVDRLALRVFHTQKWTQMFQKYSQCSESAGVIGEKARSTAEEFKRQEKEMAESATHSGKEAWKEVKDVVSSESQTDSELAKEKFKENVEKGSYDKTGRE